MRVLVTGANGFIGRTLCGELARLGHEVHAAIRNDSANHRLLCSVGFVGEMDAGTNWHSALGRIDAVVHLAARTHVMSDDALDPIAAYRRINVDATLRLAQQAASAGVRRLIYLSSIKVNGERTGNHAFRECDPPAPEDAYGVSKLEAELKLKALCSTSGLQLTVLRPPLVYGAGVKGNLLRLMRAIDRGYPLPIGAVRNRRSLIALDNLVSAIVCCLEHPSASGATYLVADETPVSSPDLARKVAAHMRRPARLVTIPVPILRFAGRILKRSETVERLVCSLVVDSGKIAREMGWRPVCSLDQGIADMVRGYVETRENE